MVTTTPSNIFLPELMWKLPASERWEYSNAFETVASLKILEQLNGTLDAQTVGFDPTKDATWITPWGKVDVEIKTTSHHPSFFEVGRYNMEASGLSATEANIYLHFSVDDPTHAIVCGNRHRKIKVRIYPTYQLIEEYIRIQDSTREKTYPPKGFSPGARGVIVDTFNQLHCWVGDIYGYVNDNCQIEYHMDNWLTINKYLHLDFARIMRLVDHFDGSYKYREDE